MAYRRTILTIGLLALLTGCTRAPDPHPLVIPPGCSWASLLAEAIDLRTLAEPVATNMASRMFSSCADTGKVILASLAPEITGDMDWATTILWYGPGKPSN
jgi:hypothetical protein